MPPKKKIAAPIDRPLSRAYLRKFAGWSTAYPPGLSNPTSSRIMENLLVNRDGSLIIRPGLRRTMEAPASTQLVGTYEPFYLNDGRKAYLFAVRELASGGIVTFRVGTPGASAADPWSVTALNVAPASFDISAWAGQPFFTSGTTYVKYVQIDNKILALSNNGELLIVFHVGTTKRVPRYLVIPDPTFGGASRGHIDMPSRTWAQGARNTEPTHAVNYAAGNGIRNADPALNLYNVAFMTTFSNELGETAPSDLAQFTLQHPWGGWDWNAIDPAGGAGMTLAPLLNVFTTVAEEASDQLSLITNGNQFAAAIAAGATKLNFYFMSWSTQDSVPVELHLVGSRDLTAGSTLDGQGWFVMTPATQGLGQTLPIPTALNRVNMNSTEPPRTAQGLVAADRLVLVNDPTKAAVIRYSTNEQGNYLNFSASRGGGVKTLTSGNMQIPACAKLWQNPQSADTVTILNSGTDGYSTSYYMAPATVTSQSDNTLVMGFEETTATPGTTSPYGCEVANNTLFHPLDDQLMKSTASNYNINHKSMTDLIVDKWVKLANKHKVVSCFFDQRIYYLVHNPEGVALEAGCMGNEVWILDLSAEGGAWSHWLVQGVSLKKAESGSQGHLSLIRPDGIFMFDLGRTTDDVRVGGVLVPKAIAWAMETNVQGANRAHDAWSHLQQVNLTAGNFAGTLEYGIVGKNRHGQLITKKKLMRFLDAAPGMKWDMEDMLLVKQDMKEWYFFAHSVADAGVVRASSGQLNLVQYRYTPISVNLEYEHGSVETFEYGRDTVSWTADRVTTNGIPTPMADVGTP